MKNRTLTWFLLALSALAVAFTPLPAPNASPVHRTIRLEARQFAYQPGQIRVNRGDTLTIELASQDVVHGLYVDGYGVSTTADPGQTARLTFVADKSGSFRIRCNVTCGAMHPFMIGKLSVGRNDWLLRSIGLSTLAVVAGAIGMYPRKKSFLPET